MRTLAGALALGLCWGAQDFDRARHRWGKWKVDSFAKYRMTVEAAGQTFEGEYRSSLTELKEKEFTARHLSTFMGAEQEETETESFGEKSGEEKLRIGDREHACVVWASKGKRGEKDVSSKVWLAGDRETPLKMTWKSGEEEGGDFTATRLSDKLAAAGKEFDAVLLEGEMTTEELGAMKGKMWLDPSVPGGIVRMELESDDVKIVLDLVEFEAKK